MAVDVATEDWVLVGSGGPQLTQHEIDSGSLGTREHPFQGENAVGEMERRP
jgi:hypothetical protein